MKSSLENLISKTKSTLKNAALGTIMLTPLISNPINKSQDAEWATYNYFVQESNQSSNFSPPKKGLYEKIESENIISTGNYQTKSPNVQNSMTIKNSIEQSSGKISFSYDLYQNEQTGGQRLFEENSSRTNVYFAIPRGALEGIYQEVSIFDYSKKETKVLFATNGANQRLEEQLGKFNRTLAKLKGQSQQSLNETRNEFEIALDSAIDLAPGKIGIGLKVGKIFLKKIEEESEKRRIQNLQEKFGEDYEIIRMPSNSTNGKLSELFFTHGITGRKTTIIYSPEKIKEDQKIHISAPNLTFTKMQNGLERTTEIGGLEYEIIVENQGDHGGIYGDWVTFPENLGVDYKPNLALSFKKNPKRGIDVQIKIPEIDFEKSGNLETGEKAEEYISFLEKNDLYYEIWEDRSRSPMTHFSVYDESIYFSKNCKLQLNGAQLITQREINNERNKGVEINQIKEMENFSNNWYDKKIILNEFSSENGKEIPNDFQEAGAINIKVLGPNTLVVTGENNQGKRWNMMPMVRSGSIAKTSNLEKFYGNWTEFLGDKKDFQHFVKISQNNYFTQYGSGYKRNIKINKIVQLDNSYYIQEDDSGKNNPEGNFLILIDNDQKLLIGMPKRHPELNNFIERNSNASPNRLTIGSDLDKIDSRVDSLAINLKRLPNNLSEFINHGEGSKIASWKGEGSDQQTIEKEPLIDPWGRPYIFEKKNNSDYSIKTLGADGVLGGTGENEDTVLEGKFDIFRWYNYSNISFLTYAINMHKKENQGNLPKTLYDGLNNLSITTKENLIDPWGRPYIFEKKNNSDYSIKTLGADGVLGGTGENEDIINNTEDSIKTLGADGVLGGTGENEDIILTSKEI